MDDKWFLPKINALPVATIEALNNLSLYKIEEPTQLLFMNRLFKETIYLT